MGVEIGCFVELLEQLWFAAPGYGCLDGFEVGVQLVYVDHR